MNILFYIDKGKFNNGAIVNFDKQYNFQKIKEYFINKGYNFVLKSENKKKFHFYDIVIIEKLDRNGLQKYNDNLKINPNQKCIIIHLTLCGDYMPPETKNYSVCVDNIWAGIQKYHLTCPRFEKHSFQKFKNKFEIPALKYDLDMAMSKKDFYDYYNVNENMKIVIFYDARFDDVWLEYFRHPEHRKNKFYPYLSINRKFIENFDDIQKQFNDLGYHILVKHHRQMNPNAFKKYDFAQEFIKKYDNISLVNDEHYTEILKYCSFSICCNLSTLNHLLWIYDIKTLYIDVNDEKTSWLKCNDDNEWYKFKTDEFKDIKYKDLIYGKYYTENFFNNIKKCVHEIEDFDVSKNVYNLKENHPIYGNTYNCNYENYCKILEDKISTI